MSAAFMQARPCRLRHIPFLPSRAGLPISLTSPRTLRPRARTTSTAAMAPTIKPIPSARLFVSEPSPRMFGNGANEPDNPTWTNSNWLKSRFHFSFAEYNSRRNQNFGVVRVMNDDLVQPRRGFGAHGHADMEIITYVVAGKLTHQDSTGTKEVLGRGSIQFMTAGTGVRHSERNDADEPLRFIQTWIVPSRSGFSPNYGSYAGTAAERRKRFQHLVSDVRDVKTSTPVQINQNVNVYATELEQGDKVTFGLKRKEQAYLLCMEGGVSVNGNNLKKYDAAEITGDGGELEIEANEVENTEGGCVAQVLLYTMKAVPGSGRTDV